MPKHNLISPTTTGTWNSPYLSKVEPLCKTWKQKEGSYSLCSLWEHSCLLFFFFSAAIQKSYLLCSRLWMCNC